MTSMIQKQINAQQKRGKIRQGKEELVLGMEVGIAILSNMVPD